MSIYYHEQLYRTAGLMARLREMRVTVCGAGALGANIAESLARSGFARLKVIDRDRVEERALLPQRAHRCQGLQRGHLRPRTAGRLQDLFPATKLRPK